MKKTALLIVAAMAGLAVSAALTAAPRFQPVDVESTTMLWPEGKMPHRSAKQSVPYLEWVKPKAGVAKSDVCVIVIPGGGYGIIGGKRRFADAMGAAGITCAVLNYRVPRPEGLPIYQTAWEDGQRAVRLVRAEAAARGFDPEKIGTLSMSAGSHLATLLATSALTPAYEPVDALDREIPCHVNFVIATAVAYALTDGLTGCNTRGGEGDGVGLNSAFKFDAKTAPMCLIHGGADVYSPLGSTRIYRRLREMGLPCELHLFAGREHELFGNNPGMPESTAYDNWSDRAVEFLRHIKMLKPLGAPVHTKVRSLWNDDARAEYKKEFLWPQGEVPNWHEGQLPPFLEWHIPKTLTTKAIQIVMSGGGYKGSDTDCIEAAWPRRYLNAKGMTVVTVRYRARPASPEVPKHVCAFADIQRAIRMVRAGAKARGLDPNRIGVMGSSAGGHLAVVAATSSRTPAYAGTDVIDRESAAVQWAVPVYPAYLLTDGAEGNNTMGGNADSAVLVPELKFDADTPPMCFIHGDADHIAAMNSVKCWERLRKLGVQSDLHTLARYGHCFQVKTAPGTGAHTYLDRVWEFMNHLGVNR